MTHTAKKEPPDKPLKSISYYLDLRNPTVNINRLKKDIVVLGGKVEKFLSKHINYVITDFYNSEDNLISDIKSLPRLEILTSDKVRIPSVKLPLSRGQALLLKSIRRNVEGSSNVLTNARLWGIKIINQSEFLIQLDQLKANYKLNLGKSKQHSRLTRPLGLRGSFIKYEDVLQKFKVHYKHFLTFPALTITKGYSESPFDNIQNIKNCETNFSRLKQESKNYIKPGKTRTHNYCECCKLYYANMEVHLKSQEHERFANNEKNYENVQSLIASLESLEALIANIKPEKEEQEASRSSRQIITNNEVNESQAASESPNKGTPACAASGDRSPTSKFVSKARIIAQSGTKTEGDVTQTNECNSKKQVLKQEPSEINRDKFALETKLDRLNPALDTKSSMSGTTKTTPNDDKYEIISALPPKKRALTLQMRIPIDANEIISPLENVAQESSCDLHKQHQNSYSSSGDNSRPQSKLDLSVMHSRESNELESQEVDTVQKTSVSDVQPFCTSNNQNIGHESDFDWDFDVEVDARQNEGPGNVPTLDFCTNNNNNADDNIDNEGWEIFKESILENAAHNVVPELSDLDICLPESETDIKTEGDRNVNCDEKKTEFKTGTAWCTFSASESSEILELKNIETICKKLEAESYSVGNVERKGGDDFHETDSEIEFVHEPEQNLSLDNRNACVNDVNSFIPIIRKLRHLPERPYSCPVDATQRTPLEKYRPSSLPAEEELSTSSAGSTPNGDLEIEIVRSDKLPVSLHNRKNYSRSLELDKATLSPSYETDKLLETFITDNDDNNQQKLMITLKCKNHYWSATESLTPWRVQNSGDLKLQFKRSDLDPTEVKNENNVEWRVRTSGDCKLTLYTMKRKGYSKKENINLFYPKCKKRKFNL